ncbi:MULTISPECIES: hypothetical protein [unclassified Lactococcus]|uniref:hypothetical protein n=1 Tax=unclassified Lactococcus TaxID=2643510 RepID=UPI0011C79505|nr:MULTISPECIES: hypothetical protein [unclassified Lactococcus]MQW22694.1 hypothetical protein [Lactococcus sp. dk101]TXK44701.1 hypothetical protein FVP42_03625 [Lactococcus sp. dk310]TXK50595.1 hypothetical protein FVP43_03625 [Lactococcus sp. dk322]
MNYNYDLSFENLNTFDIELFDDETLELSPTELLKREEQLKNILNSLFNDEQEIECRFSSISNFTKNRLLSQLNSNDYNSVLCKVENGVLLTTITIKFKHEKIRKLVKSIITSDFPDFRKELNYPKFHADSLILTDIERKNSIQLFDDRYVRINFSEEETQLKFANKYKLERPEDWG